MVLDSHFSTILFRTQEECTIIIIILVRMEAFYSSTCTSRLLVFEFLISFFNVSIFTDYVKKLLLKLLLLLLSLLLLLLLLLLL